MPIPIKPPRGSFNNLPDVRMVQHNPDAYGAAEGRALGDVGRGVGALGKAAENWAGRLAAQAREKEAADDEAFYQSLQRDQVSMLKTGDRFSDEYADFTPYFSRLGDAAHGSATDFMNTFGGHAQRRIDEYGVSEERKARLRTRAGQLLNSGYLRLQDFEDVQMRAATGQSLEGSLKRQMENLASWATDDDMVKIALGDIAYTASMLAKHQGLSGKAEDDFVRTAVGNAQAQRVTLLLNSADALDVAPTRDFLDERFEEELETARRVFSESEELTELQKQELNQQISRVERSRERKRDGVVQAAVNAVQADFYAFSQGNLSRDAFMGKVAGLPKYQREKFEWDVAQHERVTEKAFAMREFARLQNGEISRDAFDSLVGTLSPELRTEVELELKKGDAAALKVARAAEKARALFVIQSGFGYDSDGDFRQFTPQERLLFALALTGPEGLLTDVEYDKVRQELETEMQADAAVILGSYFERLLGDDALGVVVEKGALALTGFDPEDKVGSYQRLEGRYVQESFERVRSPGIRGDLLYGAQRFDQGKAWAPARIEWENRKQDLLFSHMTGAAKAFEKYMRVPRKPGDPTPEAFLDNFFKPTRDGLQKLSIEQRISEQDLIVDELLHRFEKATYNQIFTAPPQKKKGERDAEDGN